MKPTNLYLLITFMLSAFALSASPNSSADVSVRTGADRMEMVIPALKGKKVALIVNQTSIVGDNRTHLLDTLLSRGITVTKVFAPEHGFRGDADAGEKIQDGRDPKTGLPIVSLYGKNRKPSAEMLADVDVVVFDIQDVGARFYTYISTMLNAMESCAENGKEIVVLDRPNPNDYVDGPMLEPAYTSFVGAMPIPLLHGMTVGELARMIAGEGWATPKGEKLNLQVIPMTGWSHGQPYSLPVRPSPNLPNDQAIRLYASLCLFEATEVSVGRGTHFPFQVIGYPDKNFGTFTFTPVALPGSDKNPLQKDKKCYGIDLRNDTTTKGFDLKYVLEFYQKAPDKTKYITRPSFFDKLAGTDKLRKQILAGKNESEIRASWQPELAKFRAKRAKYVLYPEPVNQ